MRIGKKSFGDIQILYIVYFIPFLSGKRKGFQITFIKQSNHPEHLFIIFIITQSLCIGFKKRNVAGFREFSTKFINVDSFVIKAGITIFKRFLRNEIHDIVFII